MNWTSHQSVSKFQGMLPLQTPEATQTNIQMLGVMIVTGQTMNGRMARNAHITQDVCRIGSGEIQQQNERADQLNNKKITTGSRIAAVIGMAIPREIRFTAEGKLWLAVIKTALVDADGKGEKARTAKRFLVGEDFEIVSDLIGLNYVYAQELIRDHAKWANHG